MSSVVGFSLCRRPIRDPFCLWLLSFHLRTIRDYRALLLSFHLRAICGSPRARCLRCVRATMGPRRSCETPAVIGFSLCWRPIRDSSCAWLLSFHLRATCESLRGLLLLSHLRAIRGSPCARCLHRRCARATIGPRRSCEVPMAFGFSLCWRPARDTCEKCAAADFSLCWRTTRDSFRGLLLSCNLRAICALLLSSNLRAIRGLPFRQLGPHAHGAPPFPPGGAPRLFLRRPCCAARRPFRALPRPRLLPARPSYDLRPSDVRSPG